MNLPSLQEPINDSYITLLMEFGKELEVTMRCYQKQKNDPPIGRNMPPIAGNFYLSFLFLYFSFPHTFVFFFLFIFLCHYLFYCFHNLLLSPSSFLSLLFPSTIILYFSSFLVCHKLLHSLIYFAGYLTATKLQIPSSSLPHPSFL